jgi:hypothetical protein
MSTIIIHTLVRSWKTIRFELMKSRISSFKLRVSGSPLEPYIRRLYKELDSKGFMFKPGVYLTDGWGCPDRSPVIGIPFYLADERLTRIEEELTGEIEDPARIMTLLRHEAGHAINYAYRLWHKSGWEDAFGSFTRPYKDVFHPDSMSRHYVRHISVHPYGRTYAQKHPDEDFAETFAVWLTPRSNWRARYRNWPVLKKLLYVDKLMKEIRQAPTEITRIHLINPVDKMTARLAEHYGKKIDRFRPSVRGFMDDKLLGVFSENRGARLRPASELFTKRSRHMKRRVAYRGKLSEREAVAILRTLEMRSDAMKLFYASRQEEQRVRDLVTLAVELAREYDYSGRLTG